MKKKQEVLNVRLIVIISAAVTIFSVLLGIVIYILDVYQVQGYDEPSVGESPFTVLNYGDGVIAYETPNARAGIIFYPESKVEYTAYQSLMASIAGRGFNCILMELPLNQPAFGKNTALAIELRYPKITRWYMCGHGSGAKAAASYAKDRGELFEGVILLGGYTGTDLSETGMNVISVYGSEDKIMSMGAYERSRKKLPEGYAELKIEGGCHSYFGNYGKHPGDGEPTIERVEQYAQTADFISANIT